MARKQVKVSARMLFTYFLLGGFILLLLPHRLTGKLPLLFADIFRFPLRIGRSISLSVNAPHPMAEGFARREIQYQNYIANLEAELEQERAKTERLSGLRDRRALEGAKLVFADVITATIDQVRSELIINRGRSDGLEIGQFVLGDNSIIGTVDGVESTTARIKLITDSSSRLEVKIASTYRLMQGVGGSAAKIQMLSRQHKVKVGDKLYVKKKPGLLDVAMITGRISGCRIDDEHPLLWDITVEPACNLRLLENVAVIVMNPVLN